MPSKIITKTDQLMEDRMIAVSSDPVRSDTLQKARAFKRTWLELAEALSKVTETKLWEKWGFSDFDAYCRKELHLRGSTVAKLLGSYRFLAYGSTTGSTGSGAAVSLLGKSRTAKPTR